MAAFEIKEILSKNLRRKFAFVCLFQKLLLDLHLFYRQTILLSWLEVGFISDLKSYRDRSIILCILQDVCRELFCVFGDIYAPKMQDAGVFSNHGCKVWPILYPQTVMNKFKVIQ